MKKTSLLCGLAICLGTLSNAQQGNHITQISGQVGIPVGDLADVSNVGYGGAIKGLYGFSSAPQHVTLEVGYNYFPVKNLPNGVSAFYSSLPILLGYRYSFNNFHVESQAGISMNRVEGKIDNLERSDSSTNFGWGLGVSYSYKDVELGLRYQSSDTKNNGESISFVGIRLGYNINL